jgi:hypothetical protein
VTLLKEKISQKYTTRVLRCSGFKILATIERVTHLSAPLLAMKLKQYVYAFETHISLVNYLVADIEGET